VIIPYLSIGHKAATLIIGPMGVFTAPKAMIATFAVIVIQVLPQLIAALAGGFAYKLARQRVVGHP
jgi:hypothetical protein